MKLRDYIPRLIPRDEDIDQRNGVFTDEELKEMEPTTREWIRMAVLTLLAMPFVYIILVIMAGL